MKIYILIRVDTERKRKDAIEKSYLFESDALAEKERLQRQNIVLGQPFDWHIRSEDVS